MLLWWFAAPSIFGGIFTFIQISLLSIFSLYCFQSSIQYVKKNWQNIPFCFSYVVHSISDFSGIRVLPAISRIRGQCTICYVYLFTICFHAVWVGVFFRLGWECDGVEKWFAVPFTLCFNICLCGYSRYVYFLLFKCKNHHKYCTI